MTVSPEPMVTGDAVVLDIQIAQLPVRAVAALIDIAVIIVIYVIGFILWAIMVSDTDEALAAATLIIFTVLALVGYPLIFEMTTRGRSLGKMAMGLRVVSDDGGPERFRQALFRALSSVIEIWVLSGGPAVISSAASSKGKRLGDLFAGTLVVSERAPRLRPPPPMPPQLAWWASSLQLSGLSAEQAERARQFLGRAPQLEPAFRDRMAWDIYTEIVRSISPPPPPDAPVPLVLAAVLAERHRRELSRLAPTGQPQGYGPPPGFTPPVQYGPPPYARPPASPAPPAQVQSGGFAPPE